MIPEVTVARLKGSGETARHARVLLKVDADGPSWIVK